MCEITKNNFKEKLPDIRKSLEKAKMVSLDLEFSALYPLQSQTPRLFDNNKERYAKVRMNLLQVIPLQVGITTFQFDNHTNDYFGEVFTFYVQPAAFASIDKSFYMQASTTNFLTLHEFDFNKFVYLGVPYLSLQDERELRQQLKNCHLVGENCHLRSDFDDAVRIYFPVVNKWYNSCKIGDFLEIADIIKKYKHFYEILYFMHKHLRSRFKNLWTYEQNDCFCVKKVSDEDLNGLIKTCKLDEDLLDNLTGFTHVFKILTSLKKPLIGHNLLQDLMIMINNFHTTLPESYSNYKQLVHELFPTIFDTKTIYYELRSTIPKEKLPEDTSLQALFEYFKEGVGRHLALNCSGIDSNLEKNFHHYHDAGWDSFCAGYIFIHMAYYNIFLTQKYPKSKKFVSSEIISGLSKYKNWVNVIRGATAHIRIDGEDPSSNRPPWLIVESLKNEALDMGDLMSALSCYGFVDIKKLTSRGSRVLVAVDNFRTAKEITKTFKDSGFRVSQYSILRHSRVAQIFLLSAVTVSGSFLLWLAHTMLRR